jgi:acetolactate synthase-1/2/3 large subunit
VAGLRDLVAGLGARTAPAAAPWWRVTAPAAEPAADAPLTAGEVAAALGDLLDPEDIVVEEATTNAEAIRARLPRTLAGTYFRSGGSGLGWALGACLGIGLASPGRRIACLVGDGAFLFGEPAAALWAMREYDAPGLVVVLRNGGYAASRRPVLDLFPGGESARTGEILGTLFTDHLDLAGIAVAAGAFGDHVRTRGELAPALSKAWQAVADGQPAVLVVEVSSPWI